MKSCIFLVLLLGFIQLEFCCEITNDSDGSCPVNWFRRKRANMEYTRWRSNVETTPEFIVKVLDDEVTTPNTNQIVAVNIQPLTKRGEKIIVGGAMVPPPTSSSSDQPREYTRFVPPTTGPGAPVDGDYPQPTPSPQTSADPNPPIRPDSLSRKEQPFFPPSQGRNAFRDESPPVSPQFIARVPAPAAARQYAPIAPVAFSRRTTITPLTPPTYDHYNTYMYPTRSSTTESPPPRTIPDDFPFFQAFLDSDESTESDVHLTRTTLKEGPARTTTRYPDTTFVEEDLENYHTTVQAGLDISATFRNYDDLRSRELETEHPSEGTSSVQIIDKDADTNYNNMFIYNDEYKDINNKKVMDYTVHEDEKTKPSEDNELVLGTEPTSVKKLSFADGFEIENKTAEPQAYPDEFETVPESARKDLVMSAFQGALSKSSDEKSRDKRRPYCNMIKLRQLNFNSPRTLPEIVAQLKQWSEDSPVARWVDITGGNLTTMENPIHLMMVDDPSAGQVASEKQTVLVIAGIQGRDHYAVAAAMYILYQLIERSETHTDLLGKFRFWVIPVFNPDGYDYSMTFPQRREWMKNLRQTWDICKDRESCRYCDTYGLRCTISPCYGVNLDRNFEYQWIPPEELRAEHPCGNLYAGTRQLSEAETQALTNFLHKQGTTIAVFIAFKEGDVLGVMYPHSHTRKKRAFDQIYRQRASRAAASAYSIAGRPYVAGQTSEFLPLYAGGIEDWADGHLGIDNTYTIMMYRPTDSQHTKVLTERVVHEAYAAMDSLLLSTITNTMRPPIITLARAKALSLRPSTLTILLASIAGYLHS
ncbi:uncharacterized protein LOC126369133 [Pectinophora gossypiella]|uniref:uncharacterized protein LOC126369133 n=1 Tax=Pectinophora gossypiella TaxID=13191 RepID=UPI00214E977B|nr:uncharacterized protein LOC126369133 [Pectinophora gossypiella]